MHPAPARISRIPLFVTVLTLFLTASLLVGAGVTVANYVEDRKTAIKVASDTFKAKIDRINERRLAFFATAFLMTEQLGNDPTFHQASGSKEAILPLILSSLTLSPQISAVYAGFENGNFFHVLSISEAENSFIAGLGGPQTTRFAIREIRVDGSGVRVETWRFLDSNRQQIGTLGNQLPAYDPRRRDWYRSARAQPQSVARTLPYIFAATSQAGMTLARAFEGGVVGVDITLDRLMAYVRSVRSNEEQRFVAFDEENRLLAHFDPDRMFKAPSAGETQATELARTTDLTDPVVREALQIFARGGPYQLANLDVAGTEYLATVVRQVARDGGVFFVLYAAPLSDFLGSLAHAAARNIPTALLVFVLALPAIIYLAHSISKPLRKLSDEAELIRSFQLADPIRMESRVREINTLIRSMSGMKGTIREVSKFVPKALVKDLLESESLVEVGGETRRVSILFTDVKDFTRIAEGMPAENLMVRLSEYFEELASLIIKESGTVDKFIGDAIFAFWNAPLPVARHEHVACATTLACRAVARRLNERWLKEGLPPWQTRFGIHVGEAVLGNVGSSDRIDYTAIGDTVNIAARLEALNKYYGTGILASGQVADLCSREFLFRRVDRSQPKGAGKALNVFELLGMIDGPEEYRVTPEMAKLVRDWNSVYEMYASKDWLRTLNALEGFATEHPEDVVAGIYLDRVVGFLLEPPPQDWDGVIHFRSK
ncbi:adenylate cyclase [Bradyrhizobium sp. R2.2-H]|jgi:adenylate cyclase|uniref:adenylate/guanylate cyclase domain-containing protein n=1 Tax=unclassified Bradyrhizobium TaxID=2631580 RepID=UPI001045ECFB|nr:MULTISPECIES: adenylate/guanylate cyclase domain-containing protein [unclassified Bradyrhizobium]TCU66175.1 adenylate cyclase [Bradyrhizobium sp. Y-H1]TCU67884.1 adenylate cyclase [Bradyrhizobium sp. R2.2-H]